MKLFEQMVKHDFEEILFCHDEVSGLRALIGIHDTTLGPAIGGLRVHPYASENDALLDLIDIGRNMTLKASAAGVNLGGGGAIVMCNPKTDKTEALLRAFGRQVESLCGRFFVAEDLGTTVEDMETISQETVYVSGLRKSKGGSGEPALKAAFSVFRGMQACLNVAYNDSSLRGRTIAIQGVGRVGQELARLTYEEGARVIIADSDQKQIEKATDYLEVEVVSASEILEVECDILAPCALGGILTRASLPKIKAKIIAGSANNQLKTPDIAQALKEHGIIYAPDFVINAGGLINVAEELNGYDEITADLKIAKLSKNIEKILTTSEQRNITTQEAARELALERLQTIREVRRTFLPSEH